MASKQLASLSPTKPRFDPQERRLSRFYEPLILLYTLGSTRGEHTCAVPPQEDIAHLPIKTLRRRFLSELAYMCDFDKGGETVTAIGLESTPQRYIFWVASNSCPRKKIVPFLESLLAELRDSSAAVDLATPGEAFRIASQCIAFATPRIKKYRSHLRPLLQRCQEHLAKTERDGVTGLAEWLRLWEGQLSPMDLCRFAYDNRKSKFMRTLARLSTEPAYKSNEDAIHRAFGLIRHYIGRLGHHFRAVNELLSCTSRLSELLHDFEVRRIPTPPKSVLPPADGKTRLESIIPRVHAEIQVLEQFYGSKLSFAGDDPFIACSKPACFCCLLYFRYHPGHFVEPTSHLKIYLNWRPPDINDEYDIVGQERQRDIVNSMTRDVRKEALRQIAEKSEPQAWHPDSLTGITESALHEQGHGPLREIWETLPVVVDPMELPAGSEGPSTTTEFDSSSPMLHDVDVVDLSTDSGHRNGYEESPQESQPICYSFEDDSEEEEGGVLLSTCVLA
ncbi:hypothetical protein K505DRAFT_252814 [Melanomma pulvis-pyrius CBS 109.77]|uniref:Uncharacterized protein n=1 Tax=Melanomma pulvis-pyrius CBS 109.77 TaxID=1314802 RepID=A0A6A6X013_9PLEO|nr:hypothetical protein K505DRAFT_252814 [Melanomma pulvis-pyrius CBS 109.77]